MIFKIIFSLNNLMDIKSLIFLIEKICNVLFKISPKMYIDYIFII